MLVLVSHPVSDHRFALEVPQPVLVSKYNAYMGGVDLCDQMRGTYSFEKAYRTKFWYKKLFLGILGLACNNAFVMYKLSNPLGLSSTGKRVRGRQHADFMTELQGALFQEGERVKIRVMADDPASRLSWRNGVMHAPVRADARKRCMWCKSRGVCNDAGRAPDTWSECCACEASLCDAISTGRNCFLEFHSADALPVDAAYVREPQRPKRGRPAKKARQSTD